MITEREIKLMREIILAYRAEHNAKQPAPYQCGCEICMRTYRELEMYETSDGGEKEAAVK